MQIQAGDGLSRGNLGLSLIIWEGQVICVWWMVLVAVRLPFFLFVIFSQREKETRVVLPSRLSPSLSVFLEFAVFDLNNVAFTSDFEELVCKKFFFIIQSCFVLYNITGGKYL